MFRRLTAVGLALGHVLILSGATSLHRHGPETGGLELADLPAKYHHHDFGYAAGGGDPTPVPDDCIGCRIERTVGLPISLPAGPPVVASGSALAEAPSAAPSTTCFHPLLPRAPPVA
ncbi:MAG: hypothetical protein ACREK5_12090 [Gemmatimonadota bacterium]